VHELMGPHWSTVFGFQLHWQHRRDRTGERYGFTPECYLSKVTISGLFISLDYGAKRQQISALMKGAS
jgi:hypothetical protein